uniref:Astakine n=1 Tax=Plectus sambesii TaxID=2011161 RepID=A0A914XBR0_9BILA
MVAAGSLMFRIAFLFISIQAAFTEQTPVVCDAKTPCRTAGECCVEDASGSGRGICSRKLQRGATCRMTGGYDVVKDLYIATTSAPATCGCDDSKKLACFPNVGGGGKVPPKLPAGALPPGMALPGPTLPPGALPPGMHLPGRRKRSAGINIDNLAEGDSDTLLQYLKSSQAPSHSVSRGTEDKLI